MNVLNREGNFNLHTHTKYCDGNNEPEQLVQRALELGFIRLGFSGHEYASYDLDVCMTPESTLAYREDVLRVREKYKNRIRIDLGIERDYYGPGEDYPYDYVIGSVHYVYKNGEYICVDDTPERMEEGCRKCYGGDYRALVEDYYRCVGDVVRKTGAQIVGHFDIVTKFNRGNRFFDEQSPWYKKAALSALAAVSAFHPVIEINTGAMARGYRERPYPDRFILEEADRLHLPILLSSDCHDADYLDYGFKEILGELPLE